MDKDEQSLIRGVEKSFEPNTVVIIGNGAIVDGWLPLLSLCKTKGEFPIDYDEVQRSYLFEDGSALSHALANASYTYRAFRTEYYRSNILRGSAASVSTAMTDYLNRFLKFRNAVATEYSKPEIELRAIPRDIADTLKNQDAAVITTNWDLCLWNRPEDFPRLVHLHGAAFNQDSLIFPTEFSPDEMGLIGSLSSDAESSHRGFVSEDAYNFVYGLARGWWHRKLVEAHATSIRWLESATRVITWGLSCNVYDAELNSVVANAANSGRPIDELIVINTDPESPLHQSRLFHAKNKTRWVNPVPKTPFGLLKEYRVKSRLKRT